MRWSFAILMTLIPGMASAQDAEAIRAEVDVTIDRGLDFLVKDALAWKKEHNCASCHHASLVVCALREAKRFGHAIDESVLVDLKQWIAESGDAKFAMERPASAPQAASPKAIYFSLALAADSKASAAERAALKALLTTVEAEQTADGSWSAWPATRPPIFGESDESLTALAVLALLPSAAAGDEEAKVALDQGTRWLRETTTDDDPQSIALRLVLWIKLGRPSEEWAPLVNRIKGRQNADGGWSQTDGMASDAWATGQALYSLAHTGDKSVETAILRGQAFLAKTQHTDGSWLMTSRPTAPGDEGSTSLIPITGAGSAWAVLGLVRSTIGAVPVPTAGIESDCK